MNRWKIAAGLVSTLAVGIAVATAGPQHKHGDQHRDKNEAPSSLPRCPISDEQANLAVSVTTDDGPVFFCCKDCISKYQADPAKYSAKVTAQRQALAGRAKVQTACPVTGKPVDQEVFVEHNGGKVHFCCKGCIGKFKLDPDKYKAELANSFTYQTKCPVMGEEIDPKSFTTTAGGMKIYYCCKGCDKKFVANPTKYASKLVGQGFTINPAELKKGEGDAEGHDSHGHRDHDHDHDHGGGK